MTWHPWTYEKPSNILRYEKAYGLKISQSIVYVKKYFKVFLCPRRYYTRTPSKSSHSISQNAMTILLKCISKECFLLIVNVNASLKFCWTLGGLSEGIQRTFGHLDTRETLEEHSSTRAFKALRHYSTQGTPALAHLGTWTLRALRHFGT